MSTSKSMNSRAGSAFRTQRPSRGSRRKSLRPERTHRAPSRHFLRRRKGPEEAPVVAAGSVSTVLAPRRQGVVGFCQAGSNR